MCIRDSNKDNYICYTHKRLMQSHGAVQNILTRVFGILMLVIIVVCAMNISVTYKNYNNITKSSDIIAFKKVDKMCIRDRVLPVVIQN